MRIGFAKGCKFNFLTLLFCFILPGMGGNPVFADNSNPSDDVTTAWTDKNLPAAEATLNNVLKSGWKVVYADSEAPESSAQKAIDGNPDTIWHTQWQGGNPPHPHEIVIDLGSVQTIEGFTYLPRQGGLTAGMIRDYQFYVSMNSNSFGTPAVKGTFAAGYGLVRVYIKPVQGQYIRLVALSDIDGWPVTCVAEIGLVLDHHPLMEVKAALRRLLLHEEDWNAAYTLLKSKVDKLSPTELKFFAAEASVASFWNGLDFLGKGNFIRAEQLLAEAELYQSMNGTRADPQCYLPVLRKLINRRRQMGNIHPTAVMKIGLVHIMRARIDGELREIRAAQIKHTSIEWNIIKCFVEVHSGGKLSLTVDSFMHDGEYTAFVPNTHVPEISSVKPYPVLLYYKLSHGYDFFITYHPWNAEYSTALGSIDIVPKRWSKTVNNAELTLSAPLSIEEESPGRSCSHLIFSLPLHEWAHTIEWSYGQTNGPLYGHPWTSTDNPYSRDPHPAPIYPWTSQTNPFNTEQWPEMKYYETLYSILLPKIFRERKISWSSLLSARRPETPDDEFFEYLDFQHAWNPSPDVRLKIVCGMADKDGNPDTTVVRTAGFDCQRAEGLREIRWSLSKSAWTAATDWWGEIRFQIKVPPKTSGRLRLFFRDPTNALWQEIFINENKFKSAIKLSEQGQWVDMPYRPDSNADGIFKVRITSTIQSSPLLSGVEVIETK